MNLALSSIRVLSFVSVLALVGCAAQAQTGRPSTEGPVPVSGPPKAATGWKAVPVVTGLDRSWGMVWLPDGRILVTEKRGDIALVSGGQKVGYALQGLPNVFARGQGGLMDIALHPDFPRVPQVFLSASTGTQDANRTEVFRGTWNGSSLENVRSIWRVSEDKQGQQHFGSRILFLPDKTMLVSIGDGGNPPSAINGEFTRFYSQKRNSHIGKVVRIDTNGKAPKDNPFVSDPAASPEVWSLGHRNIQGMARDPRSGRIYANEHGARGGDELNRIEAGKNYGWPSTTYSVEYSGREITPNRSLPGMVDPLVVWTPCPAPSGLAFLTSDKYPAWRGDLFSGGLAGQDVRRIDLDASGRVLGQERLDIGTRVRDVRQGPDGFLYVLTDDQPGSILRIELN